MPKAYAAVVNQRNEIYMSFFLNCHMIQIEFFVHMELVHFVKRCISQIGFSKESYIIKGQYANQYAE